jgi:N,N'-diacetyllegionaminate synthase
MVKTIRLGKQEIGENKPVFITFEAGPTHNGIESAKKMLIAAAEVGANAIKFQKVDPDRSCPDKKLLFEYDVLIDKATGQSEKIKEPLYDILTRRYLTELQFKELANLANRLGIEIFSTVQFPEDIKFFKDLNFKTIKIASTNLTNYQLIKVAAKSGMMIQLDTGMSQISDIEKTIDFFKSEGGCDFIIHNCPSGYPAKIDSINLNMIPMLKSLFGMPVAYSDHTDGNIMDIAAISKGANLIEKTITEDRLQQSVEHIMSIELTELSKFIKTIREVEKAFGSTRRVLNKNETIQKNKIKRSIFLIKDKLKGSYVLDEDVEMKMDPNGISYPIFNELKRYPLLRNCKKNEKLTYKDFQFE